MKERPILFSSPMVRAILDGRKSQTRRVVKGEITTIGTMDYLNGQPLDGCSVTLWQCPYGVPGDRLWVRETFIHEPADYCWQASVSIPSRPASTVYRADCPDARAGEGWRPSIHMPRRLSRITLEIEAIRVERLQDISEADARAEGVTPNELEKLHDNWGGVLFRRLWEQINGAGSWDRNPWVWVVHFHRVEQ